MTVTCRNCSSRVSIPDELVQLGGFLVQCSECESPVSIDPEEIAQAEGFELSLSAAAEVLGSPARSGVRDGSAPAETDSSIIDELQEAPTVSATPPDAPRASPSYDGRPAPEATIRMALDVLHEPGPMNGSFSAPPAALAASAAPAEATVRLEAIGTAVDPRAVLASGGASAATMQLDTMVLPPLLGAPPRPARQRFRIRNQDGSESLRNSLELIRLIRDGRLSREQEIAPEGSETWRRAETMQEIERYFELREQAVKDSLVPARSSPWCVNHRTSLSAWRCRSCGEYFCADCVKVQRIGGTRTVPCPFCSQLCQPVETLKWRILDWPELPRLLRFPLVGWGPIYWVAYAIQSWLAPFAGLLGGPILTFFLLVYGILVVRESAAGRNELPTWPSPSVWSSLASRAVPAFVAILLATAPLALAIGFSLRGSAADAPSADGAALASARPQASLPVQAAPHESRSPSAALRATRARLLSGIL